MSLRPKTWEVLRQAVDEGVAYGWSRAHKYDENPTEEAIKDAIHEAVMSSIGGWFDLTDNEADESLLRPQHCVTHHYACDCREAAHKAEIEALKAAVAALTKQPDPD